MELAKKWLQNKTVLASVAALALVVSGVVFAPSSKAAPSPNIAKSDTQWHDGLNHFILTPAAAAEALAQNPTPAPIPAPVETTTTTSTTVDAAHPKQIPPDAIESKSPQGKIIWILKDGSLVDENGNPITETDTPEATEPPESEPAHATAEPKPAVGGEIGIVASRTFADTVREWTGVNSVEPMNNGLVAIATTLTKSELEKRPELSRVDNNQLLEMSSVANGSPNDPLYTQEWMLRNTGNSSQTSGATSGTTGADTHAPSAWAKATGQGVVVADVDSGVDIAHQDLTNQIWHNSHETCGNGIDDDHNGYVDDCNGYDFGVGDNNPSPDVSGSFGSHGTHVAGIIGAQSDNNTGIAGMAPNARIMPVKIASGSQLQTAAIYSAIMYAVDNGAKIINASWGTGPDTARSSAYVMEQAVQYAQTHGVLFVVAAGNDAVNIDQHQSWPASFSLYYNNVLTVGASTNADSIASFSNFGAASVSLFAPGWFIESTLPGNSYGMMSGTSMASPCAAGAAALLLERQPTFTPVQLINQMKSSVDSIPSLYGYSQSSRLNAATAVGAASDPFSVDYKNFSVALPDTPFAGIATLHLNDPTLVTGTTKVRASVITPEQGYVYAVSGMPIGSGTGSALTNTITDDNGQASLLTLSSANVTAAASSAGLPLTLGIQLPTGDYGLMLQLTDSTDHVLMNGSAVYFSVSLQNTPTTTTTIAGGSGSSTTSTTAASSPSTTAAPSGTTTTTTAAPGHGGTTTTTHAPSGGSGGGSGATTTTTAASGGGSGGGSSGGGSGGGSSGGGSGGGSPATTAPPGSGSGGGGGSTVTTTPAGGGSGGGGSPATTAPPGGGSGGGGSTPADPGTPVSPSTTIPSNGDPTPAPVTSNGWTFASRYPSSGSDVGGTMVMLSGVFPDYSHATVKMGGNTATVFYATPSSIWLITPAHSAGLTDITITAPSVTLAMPSAFRYLSTSGSSGGGSGGSSGGSGSGSSGTTTTTVAGGSGGSSGGSSGGATTTTVVPPAWRGNLKLVRLPSSNTWGSFSSTAWPARDCKTTTCAGVAVR